MTETLAFRRTSRRKLTAAEKKPRACSSEMVSLMMNAEVKKVVPGLTARSAF
jgi:hypothetical protein